MKEEKKEKEGRKRDIRPRVTQVLGKYGRWLLLLVLLVQNWWCVNAAEEELQRETGMLERMRQQEVSEGARSREECTWRLEPRGETEVPNIIIVSDAVGGTKWTRMAKATGGSG